jgi:hypothetical protein
MTIAAEARRAFYRTPIGRLLLRFENSTAAYWQADGRDLSQKRLEQMGEHEDAARRELINALTAREQVAQRVITAWRAIGRCEDEFGVNSEYCGECRDQLDTAITELDASLNVVRAQQ